MARDLRSGTPGSSQRPCERGSDVRDFGGQRVASGPCVDREGQPVRHGAYIFPRSTNPVLLWSIAAGVGLSVLLVAVHFGSPFVRPNQSGFGLRASLAPAPTFSGHSLAGFDCVQCHTPRRDVEDARCERCHDPAVSARLSGAAHAFGGTSVLRTALTAPAVACATCHVDHRGANVNLSDVDDRECAACHRVAPDANARLSSFARHPEFALVTAGAEGGSGLRWFNHRSHLTKVADKFQKTCEFCHERAPQAPAFSPISFPRHCATCHEDDLSESAGTLPSALVSALGRLPSPLATRADPDDPGRQAIVGLKHADPWVLRTVQGLRTVFDPSGVAAERITLDRQVAQLELTLRFPLATGGAAWTDLEAFLRSRPATTAGAGSMNDALPDVAKAVESFAATVGSSSAAAAQLRSDAARIGQGAPPPAAADGARAATVRPLLQLIDATLARATAAGDSERARRAAELRARVEKLPPLPPGVAFSEPVAAAFDALLQSVSDLADPAARAEADRLRYLTAVARQRAASGIDPTAFDLHRLQTLTLLDAVQRQLSRPAESTTDPRLAALLARTGAVRQRVLATHYGLSSDEARERFRFFNERELDRARIDTELDARQLRIPAPAIPSGDDRIELQRRLDRLRQRLAAIAPALAGSIQPDAALATIAALIGREAQDAEANALKKNRCTLCHELVPGGSELAPVRLAGGSLLLQANFTHEPHMTAEGRNCETCHTAIRQSTASRDLNVPGIDSCRTCHAPGKQAARAIRCASCHTYHAASQASLMWMP